MRDKSQVVLAGVLFEWEGEPPGEPKKGVYV